MVFSISLDYYFLDDFGFFSQFQCSQNPSQPGRNCKNMSEGEEREIVWNCLTEIEIGNCLKAWFMVLGRNRESPSCSNSHSETIGI